MIARTKVTGFGAAKGSFVTDGDVELQSIGDCGFRPRAVIAWWSRQTRHGTERANRGGMGFWTAEGSASVAWRSADEETSTRTGHVADAAALVGLGDAGEEIAMRAQVESLDASGFTLRWTTRPVEQWIIHFLALGGTSVGGSRVGWITLDASLARVDMGLADLRPDLLLLVPAPLETSARTEDLTIGIGAVSARGQAAAGYSCRDGAAPGVVIAAQRSDIAVVALDALKGVATAGAFRHGRLRWCGGEREAHRFCYLAVEGLRVKVGTDVSTAGPGARRTRVGFRPEALLLFSWGLAPSPQPRRIGRLCVGAASGPMSGCTSWDDRNVDAGHTCTHVASSVEHALLVTDTRTGGIHAHAELSSIDDQGFTLDWRRSDGGPRQFAYVALGGRDTGSRVGRVLNLIARSPRAGRRP